MKAEIIYPKFKPEQDGRVKILPSEYPKIIKLYSEIKSFRAIARVYGVQKETIKAIIDPKWYRQRQLKQYAQKPWLNWYKNNKGEKWNARQREYKHRKLILQGEEIRTYRHSKRGIIFDEIPCQLCRKMFLPKNKAQKHCCREHYLITYYKKNK